MSVSFRTPERVLILKADRFSALAIRNLVAEVLPTSTITWTAKISEATSNLLEAPYDLVVTGIEVMAGDVFEFLAFCTTTPRRAHHVLVVTSHREPQVLAALGKLPIDGVFDARTEEPDALSEAVRTVVSGKPFWSETLLLERWRAEGVSGHVCPELARHERLVLAVISDGCSDVVAGIRLRLSKFTIQSIRRSLYRKFGVKNKTGIIKVGEKLGFVLRTIDGRVIRPGLASMLTAAKARPRIKAE